MNNLTNPKKKFFALLFSIISLPCFSQGEGDRIIAIVGNDIILQSELNFQIYNFATQNNLQQINDAVIQKVFQNLLTEKLILAKAEQDSIYVTQDEINKQVEGRLKELVSQFGSEKNLESVYGITISKIKSLLGEQVERSIKVNRVKQEKFGYGISVSKREAVKFFEEYQDSIPAVPETFELYQIVRIPKITEDAKYMAKEKALQILDSIKAGKDFSELAKKYSDDSLSAIQGGNLGKAKKGTFVKEFENAAYLLKEGEVSDVVETEFGYHVIKLLARTGDIIETQHILIRFPRLEAADFAEIGFLKDLKSKILNGELSFKKAASLHSQETQSAADSGYVGKISITNLDSLEIIALRDLNAGEISDPVKVGDDRNYGYYMYLLKERIPEHKASLESDYQLIENFALRFKEQKLLNEWMEELKKTIYVEIKI
ncbi:MAG: peptidylprolyl isomerase [Chlorobi bacterium]|nr:peptidylprolyl isomerase [Chlorobiota bacterium]MCI0714954.1 peptidylprolyl isomerase [Chlorobiota bacterium]